MCKSNFIPKLALGINSVGYRLFFRPITFLTSWVFAHKNNNAYSEPKIKVALLQNYNEAHIALNGRFLLPDGRAIDGQFTVRADKGLVGLIDSSGKEILRQKKFYF